MRFDYFLGVDPGLVHDPSGLCLVRSIRPAVVVQKGRVINAETGQVVPLPKGTTVAEYCSPRYSVTDCQSRQGLTFEQTAREARSIMRDMGDCNFLAVCDSTGLGVGATDAIRRAGVPCIGVTLTSGSKITGNRWNWNVPVSLLFSGMYSLMSQDRLKVTDPKGQGLIAELKEIEKRVSDAGRESFEVATGENHHGDLVFAVGLALIAAERRVGRQSRTLALNPGGHERKPGRPRQGNTARRVIKARLEQSRARAQADMYRQIGQTDDPFYE